MNDETGFGVEKNWKHASGLVASRGETNSAFAKRNYAVKCRTTGDVIAVVGGYHIWWCNPHHQPLAWCDKARAEAEARNDVFNAIDMCFKVGDRNEPGGIICNEKDCYEDAICNHVIEKLRKELSK